MYLRLHVQYRTEKESMYAHIHLIHTDTAGKGTAECADLIASLSTISVMTTTYSFELQGYL